MYDPTNMSPEDELLEQASTEYFAAVSRGDAPSISEFTKRYPTIADLIKTSFPALALLERKHKGNKVSHNEHEIPKALGEFKILQEIGRGGMGMVFEAEQQSMGRRVALKMLPFASMLDPTRLVRFKNEIRAAGTLDHEHIVSIYSVGEERGIHYYTMQLVHGQSVAQVINQLRTNYFKIGPTSITQVVSHSISYDETTCVEDNGNQALSSAEGLLEKSTPKTTLSKLTRTSDKLRREYYRAVARMGEQVALALEHAHQRGIIHRDIKPANLLIDSHGEVYVTDFGLARIEADVGLTMTGDMLGTLRYMAPEQLSGSPGDVTQRSDIYSLGATLYELLVLQPAFPQEDRGQLIEQVMHGVPTSLRKLAPGIPADLETIISKALEKSPKDRYCSALEFAQDLRRFHENQPILAKPPTLVDRAIKWSRRHSDLAWTSAAFLIFLTIVSVIATSTIFSLYRESELQRRIAQTAQNMAEIHRNELQQEVYSLDMQNAFTHREEGRFDIAQRLLAKHQPVDGRPDVRSFGWYALREYTSRPDPLVLAGHQGPVREVAIYPDYKRLVSAGDDGTIRTWNSSTGELLSTIKVSDKSLNALALSPNKEMIVTGNRSLQLWDLENAVLIDKIAEFESTIEEAMFSPNGRFVAAGSRDSVIRIVDLKSRKVITLDVQCANQSLLFTDGGTTITGTCKEEQDRIIRSWDCETGQVKREILSSNGNAELMIAPNNEERLVVAGTRKSYLTFLDLKSNKEFYKAPTVTGNLKDLALSPNNARLVAAAAGGTLRYWTLHYDWTTSPLKRVIVGDEVIFPAHFGDTTSIAFLNNNRLVSCGEDGLIKIWQGHEPRRTTRIIGDSTTSQFTFSPDVDKILSYASDGQLRLRQIESNELTWEVASSRESAKFLDFSADGQHFVAVDHENHVDVWKIGGEAPLLSFEHTNKVLHVALSPDGQMVAITGRDGETSVRNVATAQEVFEAEIDGWGWAIKFSPNGKLLALGGEIPEILLFDTNSWKIVHRLPGSSDTRLLEFNVGGQSLASIHRDKSIRIWDTQSGRQKVVLDAYDTGNGPILSLAFHPDDKTLAVGAYKNSVQLWHLPTQRELGAGLRLYESEIKYAHQLAFSPDGRNLLALVKKHNSHKYKTHYLEILQTDF